MKPNPLLIISVIFAASFSGRAVTVASATARSVEPPALSDPTVLAEAAKPAKAVDKPAGLAPGEQPVIDAAAPAAPEPAADSLVAAMPTMTTDEFLAAMRARAETIDAREAKLRERERAFAVVEKRLGERIDQLEALRTELDRRLAAAATAAESDIAQLAQMYQNMKPQRAAEIFDAMDPSFAAGFLTEMNSESAALILGNMQTEKAYAASILIAGRNASINQR